MKIPVYITTRDRVSPLKKLVSWLEKTGEAQIVILDNDSTYPPMLKYLDSCPHPVYRQYHNNFGHLVAWKSKIMDTYPSDYFVVTDDDCVPSTTCPLDTISYLIKAKRDHPQYSVVGLGLEIKNLPKHYRRRDEVIKWEGEFWKKPVGDFFEAKIDTSFALYERGGYNDPERPALRSNYPYTAKHTTWYVNSNKPTNEEKYYLSRASAKVSNWSRGHIKGYE